MPTFSISKTAEGDFGIGSLHWKLLNRCNYDLYWSSNLNEAQI
jgi:hypothetical protein